jgi:dihydrofolate synthase / folylpolyglutamate synthase
MARSDAILTRLLSLHPKIIDLSLGRTRHLLSKLGNPETRLPPVIHIAGTNGKGSCSAYLRSIVEAAGLKAHCYTSPHLVKFHERIRVAGQLIAEDNLATLLEECETANGGEPITFFEITTVAAFLAFARTRADYLILETGLGGRLDSTNVIAKPAATCITTIGLDHQQYLGETIELIAAEKAGILKRGVPGIVGRVPQDARAVIEHVAEIVGAPLAIADQDWQAYEQHGRMVFQDNDGLLDLPLPNLVGAHQIQNAGNAIAIIRVLKDKRITDPHVAKGITSASWPARMQKLGPGHLMLPNTEIWLDGGHNADAGQVLANAFAHMHKRPLVIIWGMLNTKDAAQFITPLAKLARACITTTIPDEANAIPAETLAAVAQSCGLTSATAEGIEDAIKKTAQLFPHPRILICGSLYLAGHVLALHEGEAMSAVSGAARR